MDCVMTASMYRVTALTVRPSAISSRAKRIHFGDNEEIPGNAPAFPAVHQHPLLPEVGRDSEAHCKASEASVWGQDSL